jgi:glycosyltransferase involved in cell wall biosynthesis
MNRFVHITLSDKGWILEKLAQEIVRRLDYVSVSTQVDSKAPIQYYMTYGRYEKRVSSVEVMLFTHLEEDANVAAHFFEAAHHCEAAVAMSTATAEILSKAGISSHLILPGVDFEKFKPKIKIAVVGRTYHTGRKGEAIVNAVQDIEDIEWFFTGDGWPGPALHLPENELPGFYRSVDYVLVPALNEGGPMCVLEALACGTPIIGPDVGWVSNFPHISFERGDSASLRSVLLSLLNKKRQICSSVVDMTWENWAEGHDGLFKKLIQNHHLQSTTMVAIPIESRLKSAAVLMHGIESNELGGPSVRVPKTATAISQLNIEVNSLTFPSALINNHQVVHGFNIWPPLSAVEMARYVVDHGKPFIFSPILLDLSEFRLWHTELTKAFFQATSINEALNNFHHAYKNFQDSEAGIASLKEPEPGYIDSLREIAELSSAFIFLSEREQLLARKLLSHLPEQSTIIHNPVDSKLFAAGDPELFRQKYGLNDYVLCVGRIEHRKNQLMLAAAIRELDIPLVLIGHSGEQEYLSLLKKFGGPNLTIINRLEPESALIRSAIAGARVFTLPSWAEGAPLVALEAGAAGANLVLSSRSSEYEYFGSFARYCDPSDPVSIRRQISSAWDEHLSATDRSAQQQHVTECFSWKHYAEQTRNVYERAFYTPSRKVFTEAFANRQSVQIDSTTKNNLSVILFDLTTLANNTKTLSGIVRVESSLAQELTHINDIQTRFIVWRSPLIGYIEIPQQIVVNNLLSSYVASKGENAIDPESFFPQGASLLVVGSSWMQNKMYTKNLIDVAEKYCLNLTVMMHDFTPVMFPYWYPKGYAPVFGDNLKVLLRAVDKILVYSKNTHNDLLLILQKFGLTVPPVCTIRLADEIGAFTASDGEDIPLRIKRFGSTPFILAVGGIHTRKNYGLLIDCWKTLICSMEKRCPHLIIVGGVSWNGEDVSRSIKEDIELSVFVHLVDDIDDHALAWLYSNCLFSVYPSLYEGWGLPVAESMSHGKICIASNSSSVPEVAPGLADLIDPTDRKAWTALIQHYASSASTRAYKEARIRDEYVVTRWSDSAVMLAAAIHSRHAKRSRHRYSLGQICVLTKDAGLSVYSQFGWYHQEDWGCWAKDFIARLRIQLTYSPDEDLVLHTVGRMFLPSDKKSGICHVLVNGQRVSTWTFMHSTERIPDVISVARIPIALCPPDGILDIDFQSPHFFQVSQTDTRFLAFGLSSFSVQLLSRAVGFPMTVQHFPKLSHVLQGDDMQRSSVRPAMPLNRWIWPSPHNLATLPILDPVLGNPLIVQVLWQQLKVALAGLWLGQDLFFEALVRTAPLNNESLKVCLMVDQQPAGEWVLEKDCVHHLKISLPAELLGSQDPMELSIFSPQSGVQKEGKGYPLASGSFELIKVRFSQELCDPTDILELRSGDNYTFLSDESSQCLKTQTLTGGWYEPDPVGIWSVEGHGELHFNAHVENHTVAVLNVSWVASRAENDFILVDYNGYHTEIIARRDNPGLVTGILPIDLEKLITSNPIRISIQFARSITPIIPNMFGIDNEHRALGIHLVALKLNKLRPFPIGEQVLSSRLEKDELALVYEWHNEEDMLWSRSSYAEIVVRSPLKAISDGKLILYVTAIVLDANIPVCIDLYLNGCHVNKQIFSEFKLKKIIISLDDFDIAENGLLTIAITSDSVVSAPIGSNNETLSFGVCMSAMEFQA